MTAAHSRAGTTFELRAPAVRTPTVSRSAGRGELHESRHHVARPARVERDVTDRDRFGRHRAARRRAVPGAERARSGGRRAAPGARQRGDRGAVFVSAHVFGPRAGDLRGLARDLSAGLWSNAASTPIIAQQDRGFRELYLKGDRVGPRRRARMESRAAIQRGHLREAFAYQITDPTRSTTGHPPRSASTRAACNREHALFVQDQFRRGAWTVNAGLRWDHYRFVVEDSALSPRLGVAWSWPAANLGAGLLRSRVSNPGRRESPARQLAGPGRARRRRCATAGPAVARKFLRRWVSKALFGTARLDVSHFAPRDGQFRRRRSPAEYGRRFPIAFQNARSLGRR